MVTVLVEVLHVGYGAVGVAALEEDMGDEPAGEDDETADEDDETADEGDATADEDDETAGEGDDIADEYDETAGEGDATAGEGDEAADDEDDDTVDEGDETIAAGAVAAEDDVPKMSSCAPSLNPHLLLYAGLLGLPLRSAPLTAMLFPSA